MIRTIICLYFCGAHFVCFTMFAMSIENKKLDKVFYKTASVIAEMCYRKGIDLNNQKPFNFYENAEMGVSRNVIFSGSDSEANNIFPAKEWKKVYPEGFEKLLYLWQQNTILLEAKKLNKSLNLLEIINILHDKSKKRLLKRINSYKPFTIELIFSGFCSCLSIASGLYSISCGYYAENMKKTALMTSVATLSLVSFWYYSKKTLKLYYDRCWWSNCINFHKAVELCSNLKDNL